MLTKGLTDHTIRLLATIRQQSIWLRTLILVLAFGAEFLAFPHLIHLVGNGAAALTGILVLVGGLLLGSLGGLIAGLVAFPFNALLINTATGLSWMAALNGAGWLGHMVLLVVGVTVGLVADMAHRIHQELLQRRRIQQELRRNQARLRVLSDQVPAILWTTDPDLSITSIVGSGLTHLIPDRDSILGQRLEEFVKDSSRSQEFIQAHRDALAGKSVVREDLWRGRIYESHIQPFRNQAQEIVGTVGIALDVTDRKHFEQALQQQVRKQAALHRVATAGALATNEEDLIRQATEIIGQALQVDSFHILLLDEEQPRLFVHAQDGRTGVRVETPATLDSVYTQVTRTGQPIRVNDTWSHPEYKAQDQVNRSRLCVPIALGDRILGAVNAESRRPYVFTSNDQDLLAIFTEQLAIGVEKIRLFQEAHKRAAELAVLMELSTALRDTDRTETVMETLLVHSMEALKGVWGGIFVPGPKPDTLTIAWQMGHPSVPPNIALCINNSITGHVYRTEQPYLVADLARDAQTHSQIRGLIAEEQISAPLSAIFSPLRAGTECIGVIGISAAPGRSYSATELRLLSAMAEIGGSALNRADIMETLEQRVSERTRELAEANQRLQELDRLKSEFVANVSHELRTPLTNINFYLNLLSSAKEGQKKAKYMAILHQETQRLKTLIETVLDLSRLDATQAAGQASHEELVDMRSLVAQVMASHEELARTGEVALGLEMADGPLHVLGDHDQLVQVVTNLLANAINYTPPGGQVTVRTRTENDRICLCISDTGMGISPQEQEQIFDRFFRGERATAAGIPGTGLGLSIVKEIVELHGGQIQVQSQPGQGSTFRVWLPRAQEPSRTSRPPATSSSPRAAADGK